MIDEIKNLFFDKKNRIDEPLTRLIKKKREESNKYSQK